MNFFLFSTSLFYFINAPVADMRETPSEKAPLVSQAYFSEQVTVIEEKEQWNKIETNADHYQGWVKSKNLCARQDKLFPQNLDKSVKVNRCKAHLYHESDTIYGPYLTLPFDSLLEKVESQEELNSRWIQVLTPKGEKGFIQRGDVTSNKDFLSVTDLASFSLKFIGLPYTWGGRSSFGYDCSGFVQMLYRQIGVSLPRDSKDQINWEGFQTLVLEDLLPGDLIFFGLSETKIFHVGMYLGDDQFIHSTVAENAPYIHVSSLSNFEWKEKKLYKAARRLK